MTRSLPPEMPLKVVLRLSQVDLPRYQGRALPLNTVDAQGFPHPMLLSSLEVRATDSKSLSIVIGTRSRSAKNMLERRVATLLIIEPEMTVYVKARLADRPHAVEGFPDLSLLRLTVEHVLEDAPAEWEGGIKMIAGLTYAPTPSLDEPWARATRDALASVGTQPERDC